MKTEIKSGSFVHVVATINKTAGDGKIMYVNPSVSTVASDAATDKDVELVAYDDNGKEVYREPVVVRRSSAEPDRPNDVGLNSGGPAPRGRHEVGKPPAQGSGDQPVRSRGGASRAGRRRCLGTGACRSRGSQPTAIEDRPARRLAARRRRDLLGSGQAGQQVDVGHDRGRVVPLLRLTSIAISSLAPNAPRCACCGRPDSTKKSSRKVRST